MLSFGTPLGCPWPSDIPGPHLLSVAAFSSLLALPKIGSGNSDFPEAAARGGGKVGPQH